MRSVVLAFCALAATQPATLAAEDYNYVGDSMKAFTQQGFEIVAFSFASDGKTELYVLQKGNEVAKCVFGVFSDVEYGMKCYELTER